MAFPGNGPTILLDRRKFLAGAAALVAAGVLPRQVLALAAPPTFKQGNFDVTIVSDGGFALPLEIVSPKAPPEELKKLLEMRLTDGKVPVAISPVLLKSGSDVILIDTGTGAGYQETTGKVTETLKQAGVEPSAVTKVVYSHAHPDHLWGTLTNGALTFANATFHMAEDEWNFWSNKELASKMPKEMEGMIKGTQGQLDAIKEKIALFKPGSELVSGLGVIATPGHTPGHASFELAGGDGLIITGDAVTVPDVFFAHPDWAFGFDADPATASKSRVSLLDMAAAGKKKLFGYHWPDTGFGFAEKKDNAYVYVPA